MSDEIIIGATESSSGIDMRRIKHVFVDFDDTACIHSSRINREPAVFWNECLTIPDRLYRNSKPNLALKYLIENTPDVDYYGITLATYNLSIGIKEKWLEDNFSGRFSRLFACAEIGTKIDLIRHVMRGYGMSGREVLLIDDVHRNFDGAGEVGITCMTPQELLNWYVGILEGKLKD